MTTKNSILLIIKQNEGIEYNTLLNKISGNYSNINSAMAALSRALKDLSATGYILRKGNRLYATPRAESLIHSEMKNKLLIRLNSLVNSKNPRHEIDSIVEHMHTVIERSKEDTSLLKAARGSTEFTIRDLENLHASLEGNIKHLSYISGVFNAQISSLKSLDFNDSILLPKNKTSVAQLCTVAQTLGASDFTAETRSEEFLQALANEPSLSAKIKGTTISMPVPLLEQFLSLALEKNETGGNLFLSLYLPPLMVKLSPNAISVEGPHSKLKELGFLAEQKDYNKSRQ
ncbi:MAG: hypothetical protein ABH854_01485 [Candidatus Diapherotrites archaeon]|nr:hypothetical protein [Candidatus Micrarchaeota archaeon]MBU1939694.1 hypothetical protein [Candidatus Micrarchaeota archaeon]